MRFLVVLGLLLSVEVSAGSILITNAVLHTVRDDAVINDADILINDGVIEAIGTDLESTADRIIDAAGMPVTPALFAGVTINRPPRDGNMAFVRSPDGISIELLQEGEPLAPAEPWQSMCNVGSW